MSTFSQRLGGAVPGLFETTPDYLRIAARQFSWSQGIAEITRSYFSTLVASSLSHWLDRTLAMHVGEGQRFADSGTRSSFDVAIQHYSYEASRIIQEFSGGWFGKTIHDKGRIDTGDAARFGAVCLKKIVAELRQRRPGDV